MTGAQTSAWNDGDAIHGTPDKLELRVSEYTMGTKSACPFGCCIVRIAPVRKTIFPMASISRAVLAVESPAVQKISTPAGNWCLVLSAAVG